MKSREKEEKFRRGIDHFNAREFFEAHEVWEEIWLAEAQPQKTFLQGLIQIAAAFHHYCRGNPAGAESLLTSGIVKLARFPDDASGLEVARLREAAKSWVRALAENKKLQLDQLPKLVRRNAHYPATKPPQSRIEDAMPDNANLRSSLEQALIDLLAGKGAHASPIACIEDVSPQAASRRPDGHPRSVWELVLHMNFWMDYDLKRIDGIAPAYPEHAEESWPSIAEPGSEPAWADAIARFRALLLRHESLSRSPIERLSRPVPPAHPKHYEQASSVLAILMQTIAHNSYHAGQIVLARRALGAWPPRAGGDTW